MIDGTGSRARPTEGWVFYGITTQNRPERAAHLEAECRRAGIELRLHVARRPTDPGGFASTGIRGCFESHLHCLRSARDDGAEVAVIVEDDVVLIRGLRERVAALAHELADEEWTIAHLGHLGGQSPVGRQGLALRSPHVAVSDGWEMTGAHFLAIRGDAVSAVIDNLTARLLPGGHAIPVDGAYNEFRRDEGSPTLLSVPNLALQAPSRSGITDVAGRRQALLDVVWVRRVLLSMRRCWLDATTLVPPRFWVRCWNVRARLIRRRGGEPDAPDAVDPGPLDRV